MRHTSGERWRTLSTERGDLGTDGGRGGEQLGKHETQDKKGNRSPECQGDTKQRWGDWRSSTKLRSYEHEDLLIDESSFSAKAGPGRGSAKLRSCSLGVTWPLWIRTKVKL